MPSILIIEPSATLRSGIRRSIVLPGVELQEEADCHRAIVSLSCLAPQVEPPDVIILGCQGLSNRRFLELSSILCEPPANRIPLLLLVQDKAVVAGSCLPQRGAVTVLLWSELERINCNLQALLCPVPFQDSPTGDRQSAPIRILLVDDSKTIRSQFGALLSKAGYQVSLAATPDAAFETAQRQPFDIAIIDYYMPIQNGAALCRRFKQHEKTRDIDLALLTGQYDDALVSDVLASGAIECMFKNESGELFLARVKSMARICEQRRIIHREKAQLDNILNSIGEGVYGVDSDGTIMFINPAALEILGYGEESELLHRSAHAAFHYADKSAIPVDPQHCFIQQAYQLGDELLQWETQFWDASGSAVPVECSIRPRYIDDQLVGSVVAFRDISERLLFEEELKWQVNHDHLTKLLNRQYLEQALEQETHRLFRTGETSAVLFIDLDRFKNINDLAGHAAGDQLLIEVSNKLKERVRQSDVIARVAGDEFVVILFNVKSAQALELAEKLRKILDETVFNYADMVFDITGSIGMTMVDACSFSTERILANADAACHIAKQQGRNKIHLFDESRDISAFDEKERGWIKRLSEALEENRFQLFFQPVFAAGDILPVLAKRRPVEHQPPTAACQFFEVQIKLPDQDGVLMSSSVFLPAAERFDLISRIDRHVLNRLSRLWRRTLTDRPLRFAVSLSEPTLLQEDFIPFIDRLTAESGMSPSSLLLTIRETHTGLQAKRVQLKLGQLQSRGYGVILDDAIRGYSSFSHLKQLNATHITICESFIEGLTTDPINQSVVRAIVDVSHAQQRKTLARQVESPEIGTLLAQLKVDYLQGDFLGSAVPESELAVLADENRGSTV